jgi:OOP family OmpA-OmpF porin
MHRARITTGCCLAMLSATLFASAANAQTPAPGFAINRFNPSERGSEWFAMDSLDLRGNFRPALGIVADYAHRPLAIYAQDGDERVALIQDQFFLHVGGSLVLFDRLRLGLNVPIALLNSGTTGSAEGFNVTAPDGAAIGDVRAGLDVRLLGTYEDPFTLALGAQFFLPTGSREAFTGDEAIRILPRVLAAGNIGVFTYAANLGVMYRAEDGGFAGKETGTEFAGGVSAGLRLADGKFVIGPELFGSTVIASSVTEPLDSKSPLELLGTAHLTLGQIRLGAGAGPGLTRALGEPKFRLVGSIEWVPPADEDTDGDKIMDRVDACVTTPGVASSDPKKHGCPTDRDGDGIWDKDDACPDVPGVANADPKKNGCPADRDGDGIYDKDDACPDVPGVASQDAKMHGCPMDADKSEIVPLDRDGDKVLDDDDKCVDVPGLREPPAGLTDAQKADWTKRFIGCPEDVDKDKIANLQDACPFNPGRESKDPTKHGCPYALVDACQIRITEAVFFKTGSDKIENIGERGKTSQTVLQAVLDVLKDNPQILKIEVQGHASQDKYPKNQELSEGRAQQVVQWLVSKGMDPNRLVPKGYGTSVPKPGVPIDLKNKELHQRVEFHVLEPQCAQKPQK